MSAKHEYRLENEQYYNEVAQTPGIRNIKGVLCKVIKEGNGPTPQLSGVVLVYYKGRLINGRIFDNNTAEAVPQPFRLRDLIEGWQIALTHMKVGDKWEITVPSRLGYGSISTDGIPKNSTLIFEIELLGVA